MTTISRVGYIRAVAILLAASAVWSLKGLARLPAIDVVGDIAALLLATLALYLAALTSWRRFTNEVAVTDRRVIYAIGFLNRHTVEINMDKIENRLSRLPYLIDVAHRLPPGIRRASASSLVRQECNIYARPTRVAVPEKRGDVAAAVNAGDVDSSTTGCIPSVKSARRIVRNSTQLLTIVTVCSGSASELVPVV